MRIRFWLSALVILLAGELAVAQTEQLQLPKQNPQASETHHPQYVTRVGRRKPPGAALDERGGTTPSLDRQDRNIDEHVLKSICKDAPGCEGGHLWRRGKK